MQISKYSNTDRKTELQIQQEIKYKYNIVFQGIWLEKSCTDFLADESKKIKIQINPKISEEIQRNARKTKEIQRNTNIYNEIQIYSKIQREIQKILGKWCFKESGTKYLATAFLWQFALNEAMYLYSGRQENTN